MPDKEIKHDFPYDFDNPEREIILPSSLEEVSGITWVNDSTIACVEDNFGAIYFLNLLSENVNRSRSFGGPGDYEDISLVEDAYYVLKSDGVIYKVREKETDTYYTSLSKENNVEGLCFDKENRRLLLALKGKALSGEKKGRQILSVNLKSMEVSDEPVVSISPKKVSDKAGRKVNFRPSGVAIHPINSEIYIISSTGNSILRFSPTGDLVDFAFLDKKSFRQPEGITFGRDGTLYISNEGKNAEPNLLIFKMKNEG